MVISLILGFSPRLPVSVCGTGAFLLVAAFLASVDSAASILIFCPHHASALWGNVLHYLPGLNAWTRPTINALCLSSCVTASFKTLKAVQEYQPVVHRLRPSSPRLRSRLTLGGRAFPRKP
jgi:hypothetical protein